MLAFTIVLITLMVMTLACGFTPTVTIEDAVK